MLGSFIGIALIAILYESLKVLREFIDARYQRQTSVDNDHKLSVNDATTPASRKSDKTHCCKWYMSCLHAFAFPSSKGYSLCLVHTADTDCLVLSCPCRRCELQALEEIVLNLRATGNQSRAQTRDFNKCWLSSACALAKVTLLVAPACMRYLV